MNRGHFRERRRIGAVAAGIISVALLVTAVPMTAAGNEPFVTWYYVICWYSLITALDAVCVLSGRRSLILHRPFLFAALVFWSAVLWYFFEAVNFRLANWYYVYVTDIPWIRVVGISLAFGTVLPALFLIERLLEGARLFSRITCPPLAVTSRLCRAVTAVGAACMILPLILPRTFFPLVWVGLALLPASFNRKRLSRSLLGDLEAGRPGRLLRILAAGLICGLIWEFLNSFALIRWVYTVPFFEEIKWFEMPPLGFLGFLPFAVECFVVYGALAALGLAPETGEIRRRGGEKCLPAPVVAAASVAAAAGSGAILYGMFLFNVDSVTPWLAGLGLPEPVLAVARQEGIEDAFMLDRALDNPVVRAHLDGQGVDLHAVRGVVELAVFRGIGVVHARSLVKAGIRCCNDLRGCNAEELARTLTRIEQGRAPVRPSRVRVWIRAAESIGNPVRTGP